MNLLKEVEMQWLSAIISKLEAEGTDVSELKKLLKMERAKLNTLMAADLLNYFPIKQDILVKLNEIDYGSDKLKVNLCMMIPRESGVFDKNGAPEQFEATLTNALSECMKRLKTEYKEEAEKLKEVHIPDMITASHDHPIKLTIGTQTLYVENGEIDKSLAWEVDSYNASTKDLTLKAGMIIKTLTITTGDYVDTGVHTVVITQS